MVIVVVAWHEAEHVGSLDVFPRYGYPMLAVGAASEHYLVVAVGLLDHSGEDYCFAVLAQPIHQLLAGQGRIARHRLILRFPRSHSTALRLRLLTSDAALTSRAQVELRFTTLYHESSPGGSRDARALVAGRSCRRLSGSSSRVRPRRLRRRRPIWFACGYLQSGSRRLQVAPAGAQCGARCIRATARIQHIEHSPWDRVSGRWFDHHLTYRERHQRGIVRICSFTYRKRRPPVQCFIPRHKGIHGRYPNSGFDPGDRFVEYRLSIRGSVAAAVVEHRFSGAERHPEPHRKQWRGSV